MDTTKSIKEVSDFFGIMELTYRFFSVSTLRHDRFVNAQKQKGLKVLEIPQLSDTRWACRFFAVNLYKSRFMCLVETLDELIEVSRDRTEAAEACGILSQIQKFSFLVLLSTFDSVLGLTKPLSDTLQIKHLNLSTALELVDSITQVMKKRRSDDYFKENIWKYAQKMAEDASIDIAAPHSGRKTKTPARFQDGYLLESTGGREQTSLSIYESYRVIYYKAIDKVLMELHHRFGEPRPMLQSIAALSPKCPTFLDFTSVCPLAQAYDFDLDALSNQLEIAKVILQQRNVESVEDCLKVLGENENAFPEAIRIYKIALTIPVASASAERSFSVLKRVKSYLRSTMGQQRLNDLAILAIERDFSKCMDFESVVDNFMYQNPRRIQLQ